MATSRIAIKYAALVLSIAFFPKLSHASENLRSYIARFSKKDVLLVEPSTTIIGRLSVVGDDYACVIDRARAGEVAATGEHCFGINSINRTEISKDGALVIHLNR